MADKDISLVNQFFFSILFEKLNIRVNSNYTFGKRGFIFKRFLNTHTMIKLYLTRLHELKEAVHNYFSRKYRKKEILCEDVDFAHIAVYRPRLIRSYHKGRTDLFSFLSPLYFCFAYLDVLSNGPSAISTMKFGL